MAEEKIVAESDMLPILFGEYDNNIKKIEKNLDVFITNRDGQVKIMGDEKNVKMAGNVIDQLLDLTKKQKALEEQNVDYAITMAKESTGESVSSLYDDFICVTTRGKYIRPKTFGQKQYLDMLNKYMIVFGVGPAGTGKTFVAIALAVKALKERKIRRIILSRPAVEAGEKLGFLPGEMKDKLDPYLQPLYDALNDMMPAATLQSLLHEGTIQISPLAYMRGRTLDNAYILLDEAQNATIPQMKMFLTRMGRNAKAIITGDLTQIDLPDPRKSGLLTSIDIVRNIPGIAVVEMGVDDIVRHRLVSQIVAAFQHWEKKEDNRQEIDNQAISDE